MLPTSADLGCSHFRVVLRVSSKGARTFYVEQAGVHGWSVPLREIDAPLRPASGLAWGRGGPDKAGLRWEGRVAQARVGSRSERGWKTGEGAVGACMRGRAVAARDVGLMSAAPYIPNRSYEHGWPFPGPETGVGGGQEHWPRE